jgi:type I restriction-modification system DNA methylase subunit
VEAKTIDKQRYLWEQFSFEHLPVEIISHIYQRFIKGGHGAVYTPPFLADLLLGHTMPYKEMTGKERILDPACGSGVFLVGAFKRLINFWKAKTTGKDRQ